MLIRLNVSALVQKWTDAGTADLSAIGQKQNHAALTSMSALPPKADILQGDQYARQEIADVARGSNTDAEVPSLPALPGLGPASSASNFAQLFATKLGRRFSQRQARAPKSDDQAETAI
jgi:hypothetical protein